MKDRISASLLAQYVYCPRAAWYRAHGFTPQGNGGGKALQKGKRAHRWFGFLEKLKGFWSSVWRTAFFLIAVGGALLCLYLILK
jgi:hypothetical protein